MRVAKFFLVVGCIVALQFVFLPSAATAQDLEIENYTLIEKNRVSRVEYDYTYTAQIRNNGPGCQNVKATLASNSPYTTVISGELEFGDVASGGAVLSQNTFTIRQNRRYPFSWDSLLWQFSHDEVHGESFWVGPGGGTYTDSNGTLIAVPPGALAEERMLAVQTHLDMTTLSAPAPFLGGALFGPSGLNFLAPVVVTFPLNQQYTPGTELPIFTFDTQKGGWSYTNSIATVNTDMVSATAELTHFSDYIIMGEEWKEIFGAFEASFFDVCHIQPLDDLFEQFMANAATVFPIGGRNAYDFSAFNPQWGYGCYEVLGIQFVLHAERAQPDDAGDFIPVDSKDLEKLVGYEGGYVFFVFNSSDTRPIADSNCGEYQMGYQFTVNINLAPTAAEAILEIDENDLCIGEMTNVRAKLTCGGEPYKNQAVTFTSNIGALFPDVALFTDQAGVTPNVVYSAEQEGVADILGQFDAYANIGIPGGALMNFGEVITVEACPYVDLIPSSTDLYVNNDKEFTAVLKRADDVEMPGHDFEWHVSNAGVGVRAVPSNTAAVILTGLVPGTVTLTASTTLETGEVVSGTAAIEVLPFDLRLEISPSSACLVLGETVEMSAIVLDANDTPQGDLIYHWSSSNEDAVSIDPITGLATATGPGFASITVTATTPDGAALSDFVEIGVSHVTLEPKDFELGVHGGYQLKATMLDKEDGTPVLEITPYIIPWEYGSPTGYISVPYADPNFIPYVEDPTGYPYSDPNVSYKLITWSSSDESVATVNKYGHVHGVSAGQAVISATVLPGSDVEEIGCTTVRVVEKPAINSKATFYGDARSCYYDLNPGTTPHPFDFTIRRGPWPELGNFTMRWGGGGNGIAVLPATVDIGLIDNPADFELSHPNYTEFALQPGFKILLWAAVPYAPSTFCGGHRYAGVQHIGYVYISPEEPNRPIFAWTLFENYLDAPAGWHLTPVICIDDNCGSGGTAYPEWDADPTPRWWEDYDWLWD